jgi:hypothetical protein
MRDLDRLKCIQAVVDGDLKPIRAADRLGLTTRQVRRLARRYAVAGPVGLISQRFNRPSNNRLDDALADRVIKILRSMHADFGPTLATEIRQADIVNNKRLGAMLSMAREAQFASNERRSKSCPSKPFPSASSMQ